MNQEKTLFCLKSWQLRVSRWLREAEAAELPHSFLKANAESIAALTDGVDSFVRMVVNIGADALLAFLKDGYKTVYDMPVIGGVPRAPSKTRKKVDRLLFGASSTPSSNPGKEYCFGALSLGGTGIRFYGEYCMVINPQRIRQGYPQLLDRNSYDLLKPPLSQMHQQVDYLKGRWEKDIANIITFKVLPRLASHHFLATAGTIADLILHDEEYLEVHLKGRFISNDVEEIREDMQDQAVDRQIKDNFAAGILPSLEEILWASRRAILKTELKREKISTRIVGSSGRGGRWK